MLSPVENNMTAPDFVNLLVGGIGGALVTLVTFRTKLALMARDIRDEAEARKRVEAALNVRMDTIERRQLVELRMTADIARKVGVDARWDDVITRFISEEDNP